MSNCFLLPSGFCSESKQVAGDSWHTSEEQGQVSGLSKPVPHRQNRRWPIQWWEELPYQTNPRTEVFLSLYGTAVNSVGVKLSIVRNLNFSEVFFFQSSVI